MEKKLSRTQISIRNIFFGFLNKFIIMFMPFFIKSLIIQKFGAEYIGLSSLFTSILQVLCLADLGIGGALSFFMYDPIAKNNVKQINKILCFYKNIYRIIGLVILIVGLLCVPFLPYLIEGDIPSGINIYILFIIYILNTVFSYVFFAYRTSLLSANRRFDLISIISTIVFITLYGAQIVVLIFTSNYYLYVLFIPISTIVSNLMVYFVSAKLYPEIRPVGKLEKEEKKQIFKKVSAMFGHKLSGVVINSADSIIISAFLGLTIAGIYSNYFYIITSVSGLIGIIHTVLTPIIGNVLVLEDSRTAYNLFKKLYFVNFWIVSFFTICLFCLFQDFMILWVGNDLIFNSLITVFLFSMYFFSWKSRLVGLNFKDAAGMWEKDVLKPYIALVVDLVADIILVQLVGVNGVLISTIVVMKLIYFPWETFVLFKYLFKRSAKSYIISYGIYILLFLLCGFLTYYLTTLIPAGGIVNFVYKIIVTSVTYNLLFGFLTWKSSVAKKVRTNLIDSFKRINN